MSEICRYVVESSPDSNDAVGDYEVYAEARDAAQKAGKCVVERTYTYDDSELVDDFRPACDECDKKGVDLVEYEGEKLCSACHVKASS